MSFADEYKAWGSGEGDNGGGEEDGKMYAPRRRSRMNGEKVYGAANRASDGEPYGNSESYRPGESINEEEAYDRSAPINEKRDYINRRAEKDPKKPKSKIGRKLIAIGLSLGLFAGGAKFAVDSINEANKKAEEAAKAKPDKKVEETLQTEAPSQQNEVIVKGGTIQYNPDGSVMINAEAPGEEAPVEAPAEEVSGEETVEEASGEEEEEEPDATAETAPDEEDVDVADLVGAAARMETAGAEEESADDGAIDEEDEREVEDEPEEVEKIEINGAEFAVTGTKEIEGVGEIRTFEYSGGYIKENNPFYEEGKRKEFAFGAPFTAETLEGRVEELTMSWAMSPEAFVAMVAHGNLWEELGIEDKIGSLADEDAFADKMAEMPMDEYDALVNKGISLMLEKIKGAELSRDCIWARDMRDKVGKKNESQNPSDPTSFAEKRGNAGALQITFYGEGGADDNVVSDPAAIDREWRTMSKETREKLKFTRKAWINIGEYSEDGSLNGGLHGNWEYKGGEAVIVTPTPTPEVTPTPTPEVTPTPTPEVTPTPTPEVTPTPTPEVTPTPTPEVTPTPTPEVTPTPTPEVTPTPTPEVTPTPTPEPTATKNPENEQEIVQQIEEDNPDGGQWSTEGTEVSEEDLTERPTRGMPQEANTEQPTEEQPTEEQPAAEQPAEQPAEEQPAATGLETVNPNPQGTPEATANPEENAQGSVERTEEEENNEVDDLMAQILGGGQ